MFGVKYTRCVPLYPLNPIETFCTSDKSLVGSQNRWWATNLYQRFSFSYHVRNDFLSFLPTVCKILRNPQKFIFGEKSLVGTVGRNRWYKSLIQTLVYNHWWGSLVRIIDSRSLVYVVGVESTLQNRWWSDRWWSNHWWRIIAKNIVGSKIIAEQLQIIIDRKTLVEHPQ